jgi:hypothetical protein
MWGNANILKLMNNTKIDFDKPNKSLTQLSLGLYSCFLPPLYLLESLVKTKLYTITKNDLGEDWFTWQLHSNTGDSLFESEKVLIQKRKPKGFKLSDKSLLLESGFGLWVEFFNPRMYKETKGRPIKIFPLLPKEIKRKQIYQMLTRVKDFRNNLYHSRIPPITKKEQDHYLQDALENYQMLDLLLSWLDCPDREVMELESFKKDVAVIRSLFG